MSELNTSMIPAINAVEGFNPADFVRNTVGEEGETDLYLDVKYRLLWFRLHRPNGKIDPEIIQLDEKSAVVCCRIYADKADPADQFIGKAYSQRFPTEDRFGDRFLEIAETVAKGRALADAGYRTRTKSVRTWLPTTHAPIVAAPSRKVIQMGRASGVSARYVESRLSGIKLNR